MQRDIGRYNFTSNTNYKISLQKAEDKDDVLTIRIKIDLGEKTTPGPVIIRWTHPCNNVFYQWNAQLWSARTLGPNWMPVKNSSRSVEGAPVQMYLSPDGNNAVTVSLSDPMTPMEIATGIIEETAEISYKLTFFTQRISPISEYETELRIDTRKIPYTDVLSDVKERWGNDETAVPDAAKEPVYSTWYAYHQDLSHEEIVKELRTAKRMGIETVIVDDGWQTDDGQRGYAYCGDWEPAKIRDMKKFSADVHDLGMKCMLWFSVPFVGRYSKAWDKFQDKFLNAFDEKHPWCILDPRYPDVREYLINIYKRAVKEWQFDGLKLDFINNMQLTEASALPNGEMDHGSLEEAICVLLSDVMKRLNKIRPDLLIEFRQPYTGPVMCRYANMLRVADCPMDALKNRAGIADLRLLAGKTAVHSDMLMWNYDDTPESAALQMINVIFGVPQISVLLEKLSDEHMRMLEFYLGFWKKHKACLIDGKFSAHDPEAGYSFISSETEDKIIAASYIKNVMSIEKTYKEIIFINGSWASELYIYNRIDGSIKNCRIYDCMGNMISCEDIKLEHGANVFSVPKSGFMYLSSWAEMNDKARTDAHKNIRAARGVVDSGDYRK